MKHFLLFVFQYLIRNRKRRFWCTVCRWRWSPLGPALTSWSSAWTRWSARWSPSAATWNRSSRSSLRCTRTRSPPHRPTRLSDVRSSISATRPISSPWTTTPAPTKAFTAARATRCPEAILGTRRHRLPLAAIVLCRCIIREDRWEWTEILTVETPSRLLDRPRPPGTDLAWRSLTPIRSGPIASTSACRGSET